MSAYTNSSCATMQLDDFPQRHGNSMTYLYNEQVMNDRPSVSMTVLIPQKHCSVSYPILPSLKVSLVKIFMDSTDF